MRKCGPRLLLVAARTSTSCLRGPPAFQARTTHRRGHLGRTCAGTALGAFTMGDVDDPDATTKHSHHAAALALGSLALAAALTWQPLALLVDTMLHWPNIAMALSQVALVACAAVICAAITSVASGHQPPLVARRFTRAQYRLGAVVAAVGLAVFPAAGQRYEMPPAEYLSQNATAWVLPLVLYVPLALTLVAWAAMRHSPR
jgi:hypothetical protein